MTGTLPQKVQKPARSNTNRAVSFKYYIHDTSNGVSFEMSGPFTESSVSELNCCWETAKSTLRDRTLTLDLRGLTLVDEVGRQWIASMNQEGAKYLPESFMRDAVAGQPGREVAEAPSQNIFGRLANALRGCA